MEKQILVITTKNRLKTDECIANAKKLEEHLGNEFKVLILDKNVERLDILGENAQEKIKVTKPKGEIKNGQKESK